LGVRHCQFVNPYFESVIFVCLKRFFQVMSFSIYVTCISKLPSWCRILHRLLVRLACSYELFSHEVVDLSSKKCKGIAEGIVVKDMHSLADYGLHLVSYLLSIIKGEPFFLMESHDGVLVMCGVHTVEKRVLFWALLVWHSLLDILKSKE